MKNITLALILTLLCSIAARAAEQWSTISSRTIQQDGTAKTVVLKYEALPKKLEAKCVGVVLEEKDNSATPFWTGCFDHIGGVLPRPIFSGDFASDSAGKKLFLVLGKTEVVEVELRIYEIAGKSKRHVERDGKGRLKELPDLKKQFKDGLSKETIKFPGEDECNVGRRIDQVSSTDGKVRVSLGVATNQFSNPKMKCSPHVVEFDLKTKKWIVISRGERVKP